MTQPFCALIVEGTHGIGKSTLIDRLIRRHVAERPERKIRSLVHLTQAHTYGPLAPSEDDGTLTAQANAQHLDHIGRILEWLAGAVEGRRRQSCFVIVDTLHLTHCVRPGVVSWANVSQFDLRLAALGCKLLLLTGSPDTIRRRAIDASADSQFLTEYARKFADTDEKLHAHFVREQGELERLASESRLQALVLNNDADDDSSDPSTR